jgi:hypothetical protein
LSLSAAIQSKNNVSSQLETETYSEGGTFGSVELVPVPEKKNAATQQEDESIGLHEEDEAQEFVAVKVEICPQLPMSEIHEDDDSNILVEEEDDGMPQTRSRQKGLGEIKE